MSDYGITPEQIRHLFGTSEQTEPDKPAAEVPTDDQAQRTFVHELFNQND